jgi:hypothetical protein
MTNSDLQNLLVDKLVFDKHIHFSGYDIPVWKDRNSDGGGIIMYYKTHVNIKRRVDLENPLVEGFSSTSPVIISI